MQLLNTRRLPHNATVQDLIEVLKEFHPLDKVEADLVAIKTSAATFPATQSKAVFIGKESA